MPSQEKTQPIPTHETLEQAIHLAKSGQRIEAGEVLRKVVAAQPLNQAAWIWLSAVAADKGEAESALAQAKKINPEHSSLRRAEQWLVHRFSDRPETRKSSVTATQSKEPTLTNKPAPKPKPDRKLFSVFNAFAFGVAVLAVVIGLLILFFGLISEISGAAQANGAFTSEQDSLAELRLKLDVARKKRDWAGVIDSLEQIRQANPEAVSVVPQLAGAYFQQGVTLRSRGFVENALIHFEQASTLAPENNAVQQEVRLASAYVAGSKYYQDGQWTEAIDQLEKAWAEDKSYINVRDLLYSAHFNHALARQAAGDFLQAKESFETALTLRPDLSEPRRMLAEVDYAMAPRTPVGPLSPSSVEDRLILVGVAEQRMWVFDGNKKVFDFIVSTGEPGRDTAVGEFEILNKIDVAYASTWNLDMPFWMGIYWAGPLQNGIHSLPIVKHTGYKLWDGFLGQRVSYGCVILSDKDAATLYKWTEVGTKVKIVPSLDHWLPEAE